MRSNEPQKIIACSYCGMPQIGLGWTKQFFQTTVGNEVKSYCSGQCAILDGIHGRTASKKFDAVLHPMIRNVRNSLRRIAIQNEKEVIDE
ncbi:hypothetical protein LCGC14_1692490 [marine sediment metagenome]|uniref:Uncharacterized protein n=1 Tax=marine sediment metagenome TaxID=412755 RepID=A0A0F9HKU0_9ZZZZ